MISLLHIHAVLFTSIQDPLDALEPLFEPQPIPFSFNTPAWYVLGAAMLILLTYLVFLQIKKYNKNLYRRDALKQIETFNLLNSNDLNPIINEIRIVLKQLAIHKYGRQEVASLYGEEWLNFLESKGDNTLFSQQHILINQDTFLSSEKDKKDVTRLLEVSKKWIKTHA